MNCGFLQILIPADAYYWIQVMNMKKRMIAAAASAMLLCACGEKNESAKDMQYIKTAVLYDTLTDMYDNPDQYLGKNYHIVGTLFLSKDDDGTEIYSVYAPQPNSDHGIGLELDWPDFSSVKEHDKIMVEGRLEREFGTYHGEATEYLVLRVTTLEKRD